MFRHRASWAAIALFCAACLWFAATYFNAASPIVTVDLRMDREAALASAADLTAHHGWGPEGFRQAAAFRQLDRQVQMYVELAGPFRFPLSVPANPADRGIAESDRSQSPKMTVG